MQNFVDNRKISYILALTFATLLFFAISFGAGLSMPMDKNGTMSNCPFSAGGASICPMNTLEHIGYWQQLFISTVPANISLILLIISVVTALGIFSRRLIDYILQIFQSTQFYKQSNVRFKLFNIFLLLFSDGILNSKIYAFSR